MGIKLYRLLYIVCLAWVFYWDVNKMVVGYALIMWAATELLNSNKNYKLLAHYKMYNALFIGLLIVTTIDRSRKEVIPAIWEFRIDICVHFLFTTIIILLFCILAVVFRKQKESSKTKIVLLAAIVFNVIGFINEFYQNIFSTNHVGLWTITDESKLDLTVNLISSFICVGLVHFQPKLFPSKRG